MSPRRAFSPLSPGRGEELMSRPCLHTGRCRHRMGVLEAAPLWPREGRLLHPYHGAAGSHPGSELSIQGLALGMGKGEGKGQGVAPAHLGLPFLLPITTSVSWDSLEDPLRDTCTNDIGVFWW